MKFIKDFEKSVEKEDGISSSAQPPRFWTSTGNYCLNKILSGSFMRGIPQGRITGLVGPSGSGKSYIGGNIAKQAQKEGAFDLIVDAENALDDDYMHKIGVNISPDVYLNKSVITIPNAVKVISNFIKGYRGEYGADPDAPRVLITLDSLTMLSTEAEFEHFQKGDNSNDQGLHAKQVKQMLRQYVHAIKDLNISMIVTGQVYPATQAQILEGDGKWVVNQAMRYALSQIALFTKLKLKDGDKEVTGIRLKAEGFKTRFTKPFQTVTIEVPYDTGMDPYSGLLDAVVALGIVEKRGSRYGVVGEADSFYSKEFVNIAEPILKKAEAMSNVYVKVDVDDAEVDSVQVEETAKKQRANKAAKQ